MKATARTPASDALDRLYAAPLDRFVVLRRELAAELRAAGDVAGALDVAAAKKPSRTAWALNQVARRHPESLQAVFDAHAAAAKAQSRGDAESIRETARAFRDLLADVVRSCAEVLAEHGARLNASQARQLSETVRAATVGGAEERAQLIAGRLAEDVDVEDPFAGLEATPSGKKARPPPSAPKPADARAAAAREREEMREARERALAEARRRIHALEDEARQARAVAREAETSAARAQTEADRARRAVDSIEERLARARRELRDA
jgi:hypothetical protein